MGALTVIVVCAFSSSLLISLTYFETAPIYPLVGLLVSFATPLVFSHTRYFPAGSETLPKFDCEGSVIVPVNILVRYNEMFAILLYHEVLNDALTQKG